MFLFQKHFDRKIQAVNTINNDSYEETTCVRIDFKAFQLEEFDLKFSFANIDPANWTIADSQKEKFDRIKDWPESPFREY